MKQKVESLEEEVGKTYNKCDVKMMIKKIQTKKLEKAGYKNIGSQSTMCTELSTFCEKKTVKKRYNKNEEHHLKEQNLSNGT